MFEHLDHKTARELHKILEKIKSGQQGDFDKKHVICSFSADPVKGEVGHEPYLETLKKWGVIEKLGSSDKMAIEKDGALKNPSLVYHLTVDPDKLRGVHSEIKKQVLGKASQEDEDTAEINLERGVLRINKETGDVSLNDVNYRFSLNQQEFRILCILAFSKNCIARYEDLLNSTPTAANKQNLYHSIRNIKRCLKVLPKEDSVNDNFIENEENYGYRLLTE